MNYPYYFWPEQSFPWDQLSGKNQKNTLVIVSDTATNGNLPFLHKILRAVDLDFDEDIHFLKCQIDQQCTLLSEGAMHAYSTVIAFGMDGSNLGLGPSGSNQCQMYVYEKFTCLISPSLEDVERIAEHKKALWSALKQIYQRDKG